MIDTLPPHKVEQRDTSRTQENQDRRTGSSFGFLGTLLILAVVSTVLGTRVHSQKAALADVRAQLDQANSRAAQAQADLGAARGQATALKAQLVADQGQRADLQTQLDQAKAQSAGLGAQLTKDQASRADLQAQLDQAKARSTALQAQAESAASQSSDYKNQLEQARSLAAGEHAQLAKAQADLAQVRPLVVQARQLPLATSFEKSYWDQAFMLHISNPGPASLSLRITVSGASGTRAQQAVIGSGATLNIPRLPSGEKVVIASEGFDPLNLTAR
jgi:hypothetical protein